MSLSSPSTNIALQQALSHHRRGRLKEAEQLYRVVLKSHPGHADAGRNMLASMFMSGRYAEMESAALELVKDAPRFGIAWKGMGLSQLMQGKDAVHAFRMAAKHLPDDAESHENLGLALKRDGQPDDAADCFRRAIKFNPASASAYVNLGNILRDRGRLEDAFACFNRALELRPGMPEALNNLGRVLRDAGRYVEATACFRHALESRPDYADAHYNLAAVLHDQGRSGEAAGHAARARDLMPGNAMFRIAQAVQQLPVVPSNIEEADAGVARFHDALGALAAWKSAASPDIDASILPLPFYLAYRKGNHAELLSRFGDLVTPPVQQPAPPCIEGRTKIRMAIVSGHFRRHSVWEINIKGLLQRIDRSRFEIALYHLDRLEDEETAAARALADIWRDCRDTPDMQAWLAAFDEERPDVIFYPELGMEPVSYSLASRRLAPVQAAGWGHPVTSGLASIDLYFSRELLEAPDADAHYRERLVRLPGTGCCTPAFVPSPEPAQEVEALLAARCGCRFLIAQTPFKLDPSDDDLFAEIAAGAGACTFILLAHPQFPWATEQLAARMGEAFRRRGLAPEAHLLVLPWLSQGRFQTLLDLSDVYLDCPSFSGYTTARMAVQRGLPILTLEGPALRQRLAAGLLKRIGADDTVCVSRTAYVEKAMQLAQECRDADRRRQRRDRIAAAAHLADEDARAVRAFEQCIADALRQGSSPDDAA